MHAGSKRGVQCDIGLIVALRRRWRALSTVNPRAVAPRSTTDPCFFIYSSSSQSNGLDQHVKQNFKKLVLKKEPVPVFNTHNISDRCRQFLIISPRVTLLCPSL